MCIHVKFHIYMSKNRHRCSHVDIHTYKHTHCIYLQYLSAVADTHTHKGNRRNRTTALTTDTNLYQRHLTSEVHCEDKKHSDEEEEENKGQTRGSLLETH